MDFLYKLDEFLWALEVEELITFGLNQSVPFDDITDELNCWLELSASDDPDQRTVGLSGLVFAMFGRPTDSRSLLSSESSLRLSREMASKLLLNFSFERWLMVLEVLIDNTIRAIEARSSGGPQIAEAQLSRDFRCWFNVTYICILHGRYSQRDLLLEGVFGSSDDFEVGISRSTLKKPIPRKKLTFGALLIDTLRLSPEASFLPARKILLTLHAIVSLGAPAPEKLLFPDADRAVPTGSAGEDVSPCDLLEHYPLSHPKLKDFRSCVSLAKQMHTLINRFVGRRPAPVKEALGILKNYISKFFEEYALHPCEIEYLKNEQTMHEGLQIYAECLSAGRVSYRKSLIPKNPESRRFEEQSIAKHIGFNWRLLKQAGVVIDEECDATSEDGESDSDSVAHETSTFKKILEMDFDEDISIDKILISLESWKTFDESFQFSGDSRLGLNTMFGPYLRDCVILLLRMLLTTCRHSNDYPNTITIDNDRALLHSLLSGRIIISSESETRRNADIISSTVLGIFVQILYCAGIEGPRVNAHVCQLIANSNGCLVLLKFLNGTEDGGANFIGSNHSVPILPIHYLQNSGISDPVFLAAFPSPKSAAVLRALVALRLICKDSPERIRKYLLAFKSALILKRIFRIPSYRIQRSAFKLFRMQIKYFSKKTKNQHMRAIAAAYTTTVSDPLDDSMLTTACTANDNDDGPPVVIHQGHDTVAGQVEGSESLFEVEQENEYRSNEPENVEISSLANIKWDDADEVAAFCEISKKNDVFFGQPDFQHFLEWEVLGYNSIFPDYLVAHNS